jgi:hypothetical protein
MALPKELIDAVKQDKKMLAKKFDALKKQLTTSLHEFKIAVTEKDDNSNQDVVDAINKLGNKIESNDKVESTPETAFSAIIEQGKIAKLDVELSEIANELRIDLGKAKTDLDKEQIKQLETQIELIESNKFESKEDREVALEKAKETKEATENIVKAVENKKPTTKEALAFQSIIEQGKMAEEDKKINETRKELEQNLAKTRSSLDTAQITAIEEQIAILKDNKLASIEEKREARELAEKNKEALEQIAESQESLIKEFKEGFGELRGEGLGGLIKMLIVGIPALLGGIVVGIGAQITAVLSKFKSVALIFGKIGKFFEPILKVLSTGSGAIGGFLKTLPLVGKFFESLFIYAGRMFTLGKGLAKLAGPIGIAITVISSLISGIKGAIKGFKEDGIIGMIREGIIGIFDAVLGGLVRLVGSMIGGIFKLLGFEKLGEGIKNGFSQFVDGIWGWFRGTFNVLAGILTLDVDRIKRAIGQSLDGTLNVVIGIIKGIGGMIVGAFAALFIKLPIAIIKFMGKAWKFIYFDLPIMAFEIILKSVKALLIDLPIKLIKFMAKAWKFIYFDLPIKAFKAVFDGIKFLFLGLPTMLIDKVKSFFTSMVESIGDAFSNAFSFVKRIGKASTAALKAALPGGESPKEAFLRVMGGESKEEEGEAIVPDSERMGQERPAKTTETYVEEKFIPPPPKKKETLAEFEARMMATVNGDVAPAAVASEAVIPTTDMAPKTAPAAAEELGETPEEDDSLAGKIKGIGSMMMDIIDAPYKLIRDMHKSILGMGEKAVKGVIGIAGNTTKSLGKLGKAGFSAFKALLPGGDSPAEAFKKSLTGEGKEAGSSKAMTPVLSSETPALSSEINKTLKDAKREQFTSNIVANLASDNIAVLRNFDNKDEQYVNLVDQIEGEGIIRDTQYEMVLRNNEEQFISPEDLEYVDSLKNSRTFDYQQDDRVKQILDDAVKKKLNISDEDFTFDKRKEIVEGQLQKTEDENRAQARAARETIRQIENGTYDPKALSPAASIAAGPKEVNIPKSAASGQSMISKLVQGGKGIVNMFRNTFGGGKSEGITPVIPQLKDKNLQNIVNDLSPEEREKILQGVPASNLISSEEREVIAQKLARSQSSTGRRGAFKKFDRIAKAQIEKIPVSKSPMTTGAELTMAQTENANLKAEAATESSAPVIAPSTINNSKSSVSNVTVAAPPHIDKTQVLFSTPNLAW